MFKLRSGSAYERLAVKNIWNCSPTAALDSEFNHQLALALSFSSTTMRVRLRGEGVTQKS